ncbi:FliM/FliN family flagellar motor switch protein [Rhizobium sp. SG2393]|uniref:FliM/FliN family flagellar motor switch protein n=1 Tax=Rhizobium sp. SG2393 TaxID=3276279 RepID=UPI00366DDEF5
MSKQSAAQSALPFDQTLLARMIGALGDDEVIEKIAADFGVAFSEFLPDLLQSETGLELKIGYAGCATGLRDTLIADLGGGVAISDASLRNWSSDFQIACESPIIITMMEALLGADPKRIPEPRARRLSAIELDIATMVFDKIGEVLRTSANATGGFETFVGRPYNIEERRPTEEGVINPHAAVIRMTIGIGATLSVFSVIVPQQTLLKTEVVVPKSVQARKGRNAWSEKLEEQVRRSSVTLEARISLESLSLDTISRLQPGDIIPFRDAQDVRVDVNANGRDLYVCEFGRAGVRYTVRVKDTHGSDEDIFNHIMS